MRLGEQKKHSVDFLFAVLTFLLYAGSLIALVYMGAQVYQSVTARMNDHYSTRTAQAYIMEKVRQNDEAGCVGTAEIEGQKVLALKQEIKGQDYVTYIYVHEGALRELFTRADREVSLKDGTEILELGGLTVEEAQEGFLKAALTDREGFTRTFWIHRESEGV